MNDIYAQLGQQLPSLFSEPCLHWQQMASSRNIVFKVRIPEGFRIVKFYPQEKKRHMLAEYQAISSGDFPLRSCPILRDAPLEASGQYFYARAYNYLIGSQVPGTQDSFFQMGKALGLMHQSWDFKQCPEWLPEVSVAELIEIPLSQLAKVCSKNDLLLPQHYGKQVAEILQKYRQPELLGVCHGDAHDKNALLQKDGSIAFFDFEDVCWQWPAYDLATCIWGSFRFGGEPLLWEALIEGYAAVDGIAEEQLDLIPYLLFARHLWWMGLYAENWHKWNLPMQKSMFFAEQLELLKDIAEQSCSLHN